MNEDGIIEQEIIELCGSSDITKLIAHTKLLQHEFNCLDANWNHTLNELERCNEKMERYQELIKVLQTQTKFRNITVKITEHDIDTYFKHLLETGHEFTWTIDGINIEFVSTEHKKSELQSQIDALKNSMEHTGYGSKDLRHLASLVQQLEELE